MNMEKETLKRLIDASRRGNIVKRPKHKIKINENALTLALCINCILLALRASSDM